MKKRPVLRAYHQHQGLLIPPSWAELIAATDPVRLVSTVIDKLDLGALLAKYSVTGRPSYHPRLMLKVLVYAYVNNIYSSRRIEEACRTHIHFIWLCAGEQPDHNTINRFRADRLGQVLKEVFTQVVKLLVEQGFTSIDDVYVDGTKIESAAGRYTFVWRKSVEKNTARIATQLEELWNYAEGIARHELEPLRPQYFQAVDPVAVERTITQIQEAIKDKEVDKKVKQKLNYAKRNWPQNVEKNHQRLEEMGERNSLSKTDPEATFMRMKEDHMGNGQLKPAYNLQISTHKQFVVNYTLHPKPTDTTTLPAHLKAHKDAFGTMPKKACGDAGYGSEENYMAMQQGGVEAFVKFPHFDGVLRGKKAISPAVAKGMQWNEQDQEYLCPRGHHMPFVGVQHHTTSNGFVQALAQYMAPPACATCPLRDACAINKGDRLVEVNHRLDQLRQQAFATLTSEEGIAHRKQRPHDVESVFGNIKSNHGFRRFLLRGIEKVSVETGLLLLAQNLRKWAVIAAEKALQPLYPTVPVVLIRTAA
jgi:transposase